MRLQSKWRRKIEIEASELELAERRVHGTGLQHASEEAADSKVAEGPVPVGQVNDEKKQAGLAKKVARKLADPGDAEVLAHGVSPYVTIRQLKRRGKRPLAASRVLGSATRPAPVSD